MIGLTNACYGKGPDNPRWRVVDGSNHSDWRPVGHDVDQCGWCGKTRIVHSRAPFPRRATGRAVVHHQAPAPARLPVGRIAVLGLLAAAGWGFARAKGWVA